MAAYTKPTTAPNAEVFQSTQAIKEAFWTIQSEVEDWLDKEGNHGPVLFNPTEKAHLQEIFLKERISAEEMVSHDVLTWMRKVLLTMHNDKSSRLDYFKNVLTLLGNIARYEAIAPSHLDFRGSFGEAGIIGFAIQVIREHKRDDKDIVVGEAFRIVGNSVIKHDRNRLRVVKDNGIQPLVALLGHKTLGPRALNVLNNTCIDCEPAQETCAKSGILDAIMPILCSIEDDENVSSVASLVELMSRQASHIVSCPDGFFDEVMRLCNFPNLANDDFLTLVDALSSLLQSELFQKKYTVRDVIKDVYRLISRKSLDRFNHEGRQDGQNVTQDCLPLISMISDYCDSEIFKERYPLTPELVEQLVSFMTEEDTNVQLLGCILAGNFARSEESCKILIENNAHKALAQVAKENNGPEILHAAFGALKNLAIPQGLRETLAASMVFDAAARMWDISIMPRVQLSSISLIRLLITKTFANISQHLFRAPIPDAPQDLTYLSLLLNLFSRTDSVPAKLEIGRIIAEIFRCLSSTKDHEYEVEEAYQRLFTLHGGLLKPVGAMISQSQYAPLRSEAFFTLALVARHKEGVSTIQYILQDVSVLEVLVDTITGETGEETKDRENLIVMASELVSNGGENVFISAAELESLVSGTDEESVYERLETLVREKKRQ